jgi:site-specific recombinase XerD
MAGFARERLCRHRIEQAQRFMAAGVRPNADTLVFECEGQPWVPTSFGMYFARLRDAADLPKVRLHDLRHTYATLMIAAGVDPHKDRFVVGLVGFESLEARFGSFRLAQLNRVSRVGTCWKPGVRRGSFRSS